MDGKTEKFNDEDIEIFLVSLEKDEERRKNSSILNKKPHIFNAVHGALLDRDKLIQNNMLVSESQLKLGEIGCYLSHYYIFNHIRSLKKNYALILEDDVNYKDINNVDIKNVINSAPDDFEILYLGFNYYRKKEGLEYVLSDQVYGTHAYIIKVESISKHINEMLPIDIPIDMKLPSLFRTYTIHPKLVHLGDYAGTSNTQGIN
jgi:GR25 family glycosyltransferase involved in LPS biosynthesis